MKINLVEKNIKKEKSDLEIIRQIPFKKGKKLAKVKGFSGFTECSSWTGKNVEKSFEKLTRIMLSRAWFTSVFISKNRIFILFNFILTFQEIDDVVFDFISVR